jgi:hypothetical protein
MKMDLQKSLKTSCDQGWSNTEQLEGVPYGNLI